MRKALLVAVTLAGLWNIAVRAEDPRGVLTEAATALGASHLRSIQVTGRGADYLFGQAYDGASPWPRFNVPRYILTIDYDALALRDERTRTQAQNPPLGGGNQPIDEQRQTWLLSGPYAWNGGPRGAVPAGRERDQRTAVAARQAQIWLTPHGFIKAALGAGAAVHTETIRGVTKSVVSFSTPTGVKLEGILNQDHLVERIETWLGTPVLGDTLFEASFSEYKDFGGVKFPTRFVQREGGYPVLDITVTDVKANIAEPIEIPSNISQRETPAAFVIRPQQLSTGVWSIPLGARDRSVAVEFRDHIVVIEAPDSEEISSAAIGAIKQVIPGKPIRYIINTHTHFDHSGGLRTYAAEGAVVITHHDNVPYYEQVWANPRTITPDRLVTSGRKAAFEGVVGSRTLTDGSRVLVIYHYAGNLHHPGMLMVYLPREKLLIEADSFNPPATPGEPPTAIPNLVQFADAVQRLKLDVDALVPIHGRIAAFDEMRQAVDVYKDTQLWAK